MFSARTFDSIDLLGQENSEPFLQVASGLLQGQEMLILFELRRA